MNKDIKCPNCGNSLEWVDTTDVCGSIFEGSITEIQYWVCPDCGNEYIVDVVSEVNIKDIRLTQN